MMDFALFVHFLYTLKKCAKTSISGSNLNSALFQLFQKVEKREKSHFLQLFVAKMQFYS